MTELVTPVRYAGGDAENRSEQQKEANMTRTELAPRRTMSERVTIDGVDLILAPPDEHESEWIDFGFSLQRLEAAWLRLSPNEPPLNPRIVGEPGLGKTRLLAHLAGLVENAGGRVLTGRAFEAEMVRPYGPWVDALRFVRPDEVPMPTLGPGGDQGAGKPPGKTTAEQGDQQSKTPR